LVKGETRKGGWIPAFAGMVVRVFYQKGENYMLIVCGADCSGCSLKNDCQRNCDAIKGKAYWTKYIGVEVCPVYACVASHSYKNCGDCPQLPCQLWSTLKDPSITEEQHQKSIRDRVALLKKR
jgi:hypothetical protein